MPAESSLRNGLRRNTTQRDMDDPLTMALAPPEGETEEEAEVRIRNEKEALKISEDIDRDLRLEVQAARRRRCIKILLLGQSESGKSTVLKNFQRKYDPLAFDRERVVWRSVCQLNVVRSFSLIIDLLNRVFEDQDRRPARPLTPPRTPNTDIPHAPSHPDAPESRKPSTVLTAEHRRLIMRLAPLRQIEHALTRRFKAPAAAPLSPPHSPHSPAPPQGQELYVSGCAWQRVREHRRQDRGESGDEEDEGLCRVLCACRGDMVALWNDKVVRGILNESKVGMEELSCFFLDDLERIAVAHYEPTDDDILRARLKTMGVTEHRFTIRPRLIDTEMSAADFRIYDVGGSRSQRPTWMPYFDDVNAIVFLAPMSAFDQTLVEAPEVNRLEDTFILWKSLCASKLLVKVPLVLLLNKRDVLQRKLEAGVRFGRYVKSYTGANHWEAVAKYLKTKFKAVQRELSPEARLFYAHVTCATDTTQMSIILAAIEDLVLRRNLEEINLL